MNTPVAGRRGGTHSFLHTTILSANQPTAFKAVQPEVSNNMLCGGLAGWLVGLAVELGRECWCGAAEKPNWNGSQASECGTAPRLPGRLPRKYSRRQLRRLKHRMASPQHPVRVNKYFQFSSSVRKTYSMFIKFLHLS